MPADHPHPTDSAVNDSAYTELAMLREIVEAMPGAIVVVDNSGVIQRINAYAEQLFGYRRDELIGQPVEILAPDDVRATHAELRRDYLKRPDTRPMGARRNLRARRKDGSEVPVEIGLNPIHSAQDSFVLAAAIVDITERRLLEQRFQLAVEAAPNAMLIVDEKGLITMANAQTEKTFGYSRQELIGQPVELLVPIRNRTGHPALRNAYVQHPEPRPMGAGRDLYGLTKGGQEVPIEIGLNPIATADGHLTLASIIDITARKQAQLAAQESETRFRQMVSSVKDYAILSLDPHGVITSWNEGAKHLKGYAADEVIGRHFSIFYSPEDVAAGKPAKELAIAERSGRFEDEGWRVRKDGSRFWTNVIITPMRDGEGALVGFSKVARDMTERRRLESRFQMAVDAAPNAMILVDSEGTIVLANNQTEKMFGYSHGDLLGKSIEMLVPNGVRTRHPALRADYAKDPRVRPMGAGRELFGMTRDGRQVPIEIGLNPIQTEEGTFVLAAVIDITERKRAQQQERELYDSLARQVEETRNTLASLHDAQSQLIQAERLASLGGLVAGVTHEVNTPIGVSVTAASHLLDAVETTRNAMRDQRLTQRLFDNFMQDLNETATIILNNLQRAADLMHSFKDVAVDQTGSERRPFKLKAYIDEILLSLRPQFKRTNHRIVVDCPDDLVLDSYPGAFAQVLTNLLVNARVHAFKDVDTGTITIRASASEDHADLIFADDGSGIGTATLPHIFDPFFTTNRADGGSGLGLHLVRNLIRDRLQGTIDVDSTPDRGTTFTIRLPLRVSEPPTTPPD